MIRTMRMQPLLFKAKQLLELKTPLSPITGTWGMYINMNGEPAATNAADTCILYGNPQTPTGLAITQTGTLANVWDQVRIAGFKLQFIPNRPNETAATFLYYPCHMVYDPDGLDQTLTLPAPTEASVITETRYRVTNLQRPFRYYVKNPKRGILSTRAVPYANGGSNFANNNWAGSWHQVNEPVGTTNNARGTHFWLIAFDLPNDERVLGKFLLTFYMVYRDRK